MGTRSRGITNPDAVVFDNSVVLFHNLNDIQDFTSGFLHFTELMHVIPELGLGNHRVGGEDNHPVSLRVRLVFRGGLAANHLVVLHNTGDSHSEGFSREKISQMLGIRIGKGIHEFCFDTI